MLKAALVGGGIVFVANMIASSDFVQTKLRADPTSVLWAHANVGAGIAIAVAAKQFGLL